MEAPPPAEGGPVEEPVKKKRKSAWDAAPQAPERSEDAEVGAAAALARAMAAVNSR